MRIWLAGYARTLKKLNKLLRDNQAGGIIESILVIAKCEPLGITSRRIGAFGCIKFNVPSDG
jgi:hypothetical protein